MSERYFDRITDDRARLSCGCQGGTFTGQRSSLWTEVSVADKPFFDFATAWANGSHWCRIHGAEYCDAILALDED